MLWKTAPLLILYMLSSKDSTIVYVITPIFRRKHQCSCDNCYRKKYTSILEHFWCTSVAQKCDIYVLRSCWWDPEANNTGMPKWFSIVQYLCTSIWDLKYTFSLLSSEESTIAHVITTIFKRKHSCSCYNCYLQKKAQLLML